MKKIGRKTIAALTVLLTLFAITSCNDAGDAIARTGMVNFKESVARGLSFTEEDFDDADLYWSYTAATSGVLNTGAVAQPKAISTGKGLSGEVGPFSYGKWTFTLFAYKDAEREELAYSGSSDATIGSASSTVAVTVKAAQSGEGYAEFDVAHITLCNSAITAFDSYDIVLSKYENKAFIAQTVSPVTSGGNTYKLASGAWKATVNCYIEDVTDPAGTGTIYFNIYDNLTTTIDGTLNEQTSYVKFTAEDGGLVAIIKDTVAANVENTIAAPAAPLNGNADPSIDVLTSVSLPVGALSEGGDAALTVKAYDVVSSNALFEIDTAGTVVAGLNLSLTVGHDAVTTFNGEAVTVSTYIQPGLADVTVKYKGTGDQPTDIDYDAATGFLSFKTTHFSSFYVVTSSDYSAYNETGMSLHVSISDAIAAAASGDEIIQLKDVVLSQVIMIPKSLTLDGNGYEIDASKVTRGIRISNSDVEVTLKNLTLDGKGTECERGIQIDMDMKNVNLNVDHCNIIGITYYAFNLCSYSDHCSIVITDSIVSGWSALNTYGKNSSVIVRNSTLIGENDKTYNAGGWNNFATICVESDSTGQTENHASGYDILIENCSIYATETTGNKQWHVKFNNSKSCNNVVNLNGCKFFNKDGECELFAGDGGVDNELYLDGNLFVFSTPAPNQE